MPDPLRAVLRMRKLAVDHARLALAAANRDTLEAEAVHGTAMRSLVHEARCSVTDAGDPLAGSFPIWLPRARSMIANAEAAVQRYQIAGEEARAELAMSQAELKAAEALLAQREAAMSLRHGRHAQRALDELGARRVQSS